MTIFTDTEFREELPECGFTFQFPLSVNLGVTYLDVYQKYDNENQKTSSFMLPNGAELII
jgi:hypothetical protein